MRQRTTLLLTLLTLGFSAPAAATDLVRNISLEVVASENTMYVLEDGEELKTYKVSVGTKKHPTPEGTFKVRRMIWNPRWVPPPDASWAKGKTAKEPGDPDNPMKKVKIFFKEPDYYIHGTGAVDKLGEAASHGCIRMDPEEAGELAALLMEATGAPEAESWIRRILRMGRTRTVNLPAAVTFVVR